MFLTAKFWAYWNMPDPSEANNRLEYVGGGEGTAQPFGINLERSEPGTISSKRFVSFAYVTKKDLAKKKKKKIPCLVYEMLGC